MGGRGPGVRARAAVPPPPPRLSAGHQPLAPPVPPTLSPCVCADFSPWPRPPLKDLTRIPRTAAERPRSAQTCRPAAALHGRSFELPRSQQTTLKRMDRTVVPRARLHPQVLTLCPQKRPPRRVRPKSGPADAPHPRGHRRASRRRERGSWEHNFHKGHMCSGRHGGNAEKTPEEQAFLSVSVPHSRGTGVSWHVVTPGPRPAGRPPPRGEPSSRGAAHPGPLFPTQSDGWQVPSAG